MAHRDDLLGSLMADETRTVERTEDFGKDAPSKVNRWSLTAERLREVIQYDPDTGKLTWRKRRAGVRFGAEAGCSWHRPDGRMSYRTVYVDGYFYRGHVLAWLYMTGEWPSGDVDHRDGDGLNNCWGNLRAATRTQNNANQRLAITNKTGIKGVSFCRATGRYKAQIHIDGKNKNLGRFHTIEEAGDAYAVAARRHFGEFARLA